MVNRVCQCNLFLFSCNKCARAWMEPHKQFCCWKRADYRLFTVIVLFPNKSTRFVLHLLCRWAGQPINIQPLPQFFELVFQTWASKRISLNYSPKLERKVERSVQCDHRAVDGVGLDSAKPHWYANEVAFATTLDYWDVCKTLNFKLLCRFVQFVEVVSSKKLPTRALDGVAVAEDKKAVRVGRPLVRGMQTAPRRWNTKSSRWREARPRSAGERRASVNVFV